MVSVYPLSEGEFTVGRDKAFMPFHLATDELNDRPTGSLLVEVQPFLVVTSRDIIVLDTGLGFKNKEGILQIHDKPACTWLRAGAGNKSSAIAPAQRSCRLPYIC